MDAIPAVPAPVDEPVLPYAPGGATGAVVGHQSSGGARGSGINDEAGSMLTVPRGVSPRTLKETSVPATDDRYPHTS
ncbi:hypothetical protein BH24ACT10_BH24ACT10_19910 [soil metagenome]